MATEQPVPGPAIFFPDRVPENPVGQQKEPFFLPDHLSLPDAAAIYLDRAPSPAELVAPIVQDAAELIFVDSSYTPLVHALLTNSVNELGRWTNPTIGDMVTEFRQQLVATDTRARKISHYQGAPFLQIYESLIFPFGETVEQDYDLRMEAWILSDLKMRAHEHFNVPITGLN